MSFTKNIVLLESYFHEKEAEIQNCLTDNTILVLYDSNKDTFETIKTKLNDIKKNYIIHGIAVFQDSEMLDDGTFQFCSDEKSIVQDVELIDPELNSWQKFTDFVYYIQNDLGVEFFDLLLCKIYSDLNWRYAIDKIELMLMTLNIRSSDDNTGHVMYDGDWVLESETVDVDLINLYFNENIKNLEIVLSTVNANAGQAYIAKDRTGIYTIGFSFDNNGSSIVTNRKYAQYLDLKTNPLRKFNVLQDGELIVQLHCGTRNILFVTTFNNVYAFGMNANYALGTGSGTPTSINSSILPVVFSDPSILQRSKIKMIDMESTRAAWETLFSYILFDNGELYGAGKNIYNCLGDSISTNVVTKTMIPVVFNNLPNEEKIVNIALGYTCVAILTDTNTVYTIGLNNSGELSRGVTSIHTQLQPVQYTDALLTDEIITHLLFSNSALVLKTNLNNLYLAGEKTSSGRNENSTSTRLVRMTLPSNTSGLKDFFIGSVTTILTYNDNSVYSCGNGNSYRIITGNETNQLKFVNITNNINNYITDGTGIKQYQMDANSCSIMSNGGGLYTWGYTGTTYKTGHYNKNAKVKVVWPIYAHYGPNTAYIMNDHIYSCSNILSSRSETEIYSVIYEQTDVSGKYIEPTIEYQIPTDISTSSISFISSIDNSNILIPRFDYTGRDTTMNHLYYSNEYITLFTGTSFGITDISSTYPITILNNGYEHIITLTGDSAKSSTVELSGNTYTTYYGDVSINLEGEFWQDVSGFNLYTSYGNGMVIAEQPIIKQSYDYSANVLNQITTFNKKIINNVPIVILNQYNAYLPSLSLNTYIGTYIINHIPEEFPLAVLNNGMETKIDYTGSSEFGTAIASDGNSYTFYYGTLIIYIKSLDGISNQYLSLDVYNKGYCGLQNALYISSDSSGNNTSTTTDSSGNTTSITTDSSGNVISTIVVSTNQFGDRTTVSTDEDGVTTTTIINHCGILITSTVETVDNSGNTVQIITDSLGNTVNAVITTDEYGNTVTERTDSNGDITIDVESSDNDGNTTTITTLPSGLIKEKVRDNIGNITIRNSNNKLTKINKDGDVTETDDPEYLPFILPTFNVTVPEISQKTTTDILNEIDDIDIDNDTITSALDIVIQEQLDSCLIPELSLGFTTNKIKVANVILDQILTKNNKRFVKVPLNDIPLNSEVKTKISNFDLCVVKPNSKISIKKTNYDINIENTALYCTINDVGSYVTIELDTGNYTIQKLNETEFSLKLGNETIGTSFVNGDIYSISSTLKIAFGSATIYTDNTGTIPCLMKGSKILTTKGYKLIENLTTKDTLIDAFNKHIKINEIKQFVSSKVPYKIRSGTKVGSYICNEDIYITQNHCIYHDQTNYYIPSSMISNQITRDDKKFNKNYIYYHIYTANFFTDTFIVNGVPCESHSKYIFLKLKDTFGSKKSIIFLNRLMTKIKMEINGKRKHISRNKFNMLFKSFKSEITKTR